MSFIQRLFGHEQVNTIKADKGVQQSRFELPFSMWMAVRAQSIDEVPQALQMSDAQPCAWSEGIRQVCAVNNCIFVRAEIDGWYLICGNALPDLGYRRTTVEWLCGLPLPEVCYFAYHKGVDMRYFLKCVNGQIERSYAYIQGEVKQNVGAVTQEETDLDLQFPADDDELFEMGFEAVPGEEAIVQLAGAWSVDPTALNPDLQPDGIIGKFKMNM